LCIEALASFLDIADDIDLDGVEALRGEPNLRQLVVPEVAISVRPEILLRVAGRSGMMTMGATKLYVAKNTPLAETAAFLCRVVASTRAFLQMLVPNISGL
jgi:hypothetical protein